MGDNPNNKTKRLIKTQLNIDDDDDNDDIVIITQNPENKNINNDKQTTEVLAEPLPITIKNGNGEKATKFQQPNKGGREAIIRQQQPVPGNNKGGREAIIRQQRPVPGNNKGGREAIIRQQRPVSGNNKGGQNVTTRQQPNVPPYNKGGQNATFQQQQTHVPLNKGMGQNGTLQGRDEKTKYYIPKREPTTAPKQKQQQQRRVPLNTLIRQKTNLQGQDEKPKYYIPKRKPTGVPKQQQQQPQQQQPRTSLNNGQDGKPNISRRNSTAAPKRQPLLDKDGTAKDQQDTTHIVWSDTESEEDKTEDDKSKTSDDTSSRKKNERRFRPKLYDFLFDDYDSLREILIENERKFNDNVTIRCPEFAILLDHVIAVVWYFYRDWRTWNYLNVSQLEWTIKFLDGILSCQTFPHVEIMKQQLEELLIIKYAEVPERFVSIPEPRPPQIYHHVPEIPFSLQAILEPAPDFQQYLSTEMEPDGFSRITSETDLAEYADARIQLMKSELAKLNALRRDDANVAPDTTASEIIKNILLHADEVLRVRELQKH